jgi:hypothetical protein
MKNERRMQHLPDSYLYTAMEHRKIRVESYKT